MKPTPENEGNGEHHKPSLLSGATVLRVVGVGECTLGGELERRLPEAPDLRVDEDLGKLMFRSRWSADVIVRHADDVVIHKGVREVIRERLHGREPSTGFAPDFVVVHFCVLGDNPQSWADAEAVGAYLSAVVDPAARQPAEISLKFTDTSDLDPFLPEDRRTLH